MPKWIRVRDTQTGHTFDIDSRALEHRRGVEPLNDPERWPDIEGPRAQPRAAKPFVGKDGKARAADSGESGAADTTGDPGEQTPDASSDGGPVDQPQPDAEKTGGRRRTKASSNPPDAPADTDSSKENQR